MSTQRKIVVSIDLLDKKWDIIVWRDTAFMDHEFLIWQKSESGKRQLCFVCLLKNLKWRSRQRINDDDHAQRPGSLRSSTSELDNFYQIKITTTSECSECVDLGLPSGDMSTKIDKESRRQDRIISSSSGYRINYRVRLNHSSLSTESCLSVSCYPLQAIQRQLRESKTSRKTRR